MQRAASPEDVTGTREPLSPSKKRPRSSYAEPPARLAGLRPASSRPLASSATSLFGQASLPFLPSASSRESASPPKELEVNDGAALRAAARAKIASAEAELEALLASDTSFSATADAAKKAERARRKRAKRERQQKQIEEAKARAEEAEQRAARARAEQRRVEGENLALREAKALMELMAEAEAEEGAAKLTWEERAAEAEQREARTRAERRRVEEENVALRGAKAFLEFMAEAGVEAEAEAEAKVRVEVEAEAGASKSTGEKRAAKAVPLAAETGRKTRRSTGERKHQTEVESSKAACSRNSSSDDDSSLAPRKRRRLARLPDSSPEAQILGEVATAPTKPTIDLMDVRNASTTVPSIAHCQRPASPPRPALADSTSSAPSLTSIMDMQSEAGRLLALLSSGEADNVEPDSEPHHKAQCMSSPTPESVGLPGVASPDAGPHDDSDMRDAPTSFSEPRPKQPASRPPSSHVDSSTSAPVPPRNLAFTAKSGIHRESQTLGHNTEWAKKTWRAFKAAPPILAQVSPAAGSSYPRDRSPSGVCPDSLGSKLSSTKPTRSGRYSHGSLSPTMGGTMRKVHIEFSGCDHHTGDKAAVILGSAPQSNTPVPPRLVHLVASLYSLRPPLSLQAVSAVASNWQKQHANDHNIAVEPSKSSAFTVPGFVIAIHHRPCQLLAPRQAAASGSAFATPDPAFAAPDPAPAARTRIAEERMRLNLVSRLNADGTDPRSARTSVQGLPRLKKKRLVVPNKGVLVRAETKEPYTPGEAVYESDDEVHGAFEWREQRTDLAHDRNHDVSPKMVYIKRLWNDFLRPYRPMLPLQPATLAAACVKFVRNHRHDIDNAGARPELIVLLSSLAKFGLVGTLQESFGLVGRCLQEMDQFFPLMSPMNT